MAQTMVNFRMDEDLKKNMDKVCSEMGMSMTTAFTIYAKKRWGNHNCFMQRAL